MRFHDSPPVIKSKKLSTKLFRLCSDESIISHRMILNRYSLFCVYFYIIKDRFFEDMPDPYLKGNKAGNRPHYYCFEDNATGIYWMIPLSGRIDKFRKIIEKKEHVGKSCDILHIVKLDDSRESVFLIQDMFPITEEYIEREYTIAGNHLMLTSEHTAKVIEQKARKVLGMLKRGVKFMPTQPDVLSILEKLKQNK